MIELTTGAIMVSVSRLTRSQRPPDVSVLVLSWFIDRLLSLCYVKKEMTMFRSIIFGSDLTQAQHEATEVQHRGGEFKIGSIAGRRLLGDRCAAA